MLLLKKRRYVMTNQEIKTYLEEIAEEKYRNFSSSLIPGSRPILGVRIPALRNLAKKIAKGDWEGYLNNAVDDTFEEVNLQGFVIGYAKTDIETILPYVSRYVEKINDWSLCDGFCATLKIVAKHRERVLEFLKPYISADAEFKQRFVAIILMNYYLTDEYIDQTLSILDCMKNDGYYRKMGVAWVIATAFAKQREKTLDYIKEGNNTLDDFTYNKAIQKMLESFRVSDDDKAMLRKMKR